LRIGRIHENIVSLLQVILNKSPVSLSQSGLGLAVKLQVLNVTLIVIGHHKDLLWAFQGKVHDLLNVRNCGLLVASLCEMTTNTT
jgi:hypothetical protein